MNIVHPFLFGLCLNCRGYYVNKNVGYIFVMETVGTSRSIVITQKQTRELANIHM